MCSVMEIEIGKNINEKIKYSYGYQSALVSYLHK